MAKGVRHEPADAQAQQMQAQMAQAQEQLANETVEASAGGGLVTVKATGTGEITEIKIDPKAIDPDDPELLEDIVLAAVNEALRSAQALAQSKLGGLARRPRPARALASATLGRPGRIVMLQRPRGPRTPGGGNPPAWSASSTGAAPAAIACRPSSFSQRLITRTPSSVRAHDRAEAADARERARGRAGATCSRSFAASSSGVSGHLHHRDNCHADMPPSVGVGA